MSYFVIRVTHGMQNAKRGDISLLCNRWLGPSTLWLLYNLPRFWISRPHSTKTS